MLRSDLCDFSDAYIAVKETITFTKTNGRGFIDIRNRSLACKSNVPLTNCISKINNELINNAEDLDVVMPMYNLIKHSKNQRKTTGGLWNYYRDERNDFVANNYNTHPITNSASFKYKSSITGKSSNKNQQNGENTEQANTKIKKNLEIVVPLKKLSNFWRTLDLSLINCEVSLTLTGSKTYVLTDITT